MFTWSTKVMKMPKKVKRIKPIGRRKKSGLHATSANLDWLYGEKLVGSDPLRGSLLRRIAPVVRQLVKDTREDRVHEALSTDTGVDALIHLVSGEAAAALAASSMQDPLREARARAAKRVSELLSAEGGPIGVEDVVKLLHITRAAIDKRRKSGTLIGIEDGGRAILYPGWQFTDSGLLRGIDDALRVMVIADPWMRIQFFLSRDADLGERPLDALRRGQVTEVVAAASRFGSLGEDG
jgi:hypothetical protein